MKDIIEYFDFFCGWIFLWLISASLLSAVATGVIMLAKRIVVWKREKQSTPPKILEIILGEYSDSEYYLFYNPKKKTQEQFDEDLKMLFRKYSVELIDGSDFHPREDTFGEFIIPKMSELGYIIVETDPENFSSGNIFEDGFLCHRNWRKTLGDELFYLARERYYKNKKHSAPQSGL